MCDNPRVSATAPEKRPTVLAVFLVVGGVIGFLAAFALTLDDIADLTKTNYQPSCNFSVLVGCSANLESWQGSLFGFPNPLLGLVGWTATIAVGTGILAGARFSRWFWILFNLGVVGALSLVVWLISQSVFVLNVLCPWCMVTWAITIPTFWGVTFYNLKSGNIPATESIRRRAGAFYFWVPLISLVSYAIVATIAQLQLDWLHRI